MKRRLLFLGGLILLLLLPAGIVFAQGPVPGSDGGHVFMDEDFSLKPGDTFKGSLSVFNGNLDVSEGSVVQGDVFVTNGMATIAGQVEGNLAVVAGKLDLSSTSLVRGDVFAVGGIHVLAGQVNGNVSILFGKSDLRSSGLIQGDMLVAPGDLSREEGSQVRGNVVTELTIPPLLVGEKQPEPEETPEMTPAPPAQPPAPPSNQLGQRVGRFVGRTLAAFVFSAVLIAVGLLIVLIWPRPTQRVAECISAVPAQSFGLGLLTFLLAAGLEVAAVFMMVLVILVAALLMATVILIPVGLLLIFLSWLLLLPVPLALTGGALLGWVGLAELLGRKLLAGLRLHHVTPLGATLVGLLLTVASAALLWIIHPGCCGWPFVILLTSVGLGAVFHTRFGTQRCHTPLAGGVFPVEALAQDTGRPDTPPAATP
jgi:hypothetical protein